MPDEITGNWFYSAARRTLSKTFLSLQNLKISIKNTECQNLLHVDISSMNYLCKKSPLDLLIQKMAVLT